MKSPENCLSSCSSPLKSIYKTTLERKLQNCCSNQEHKQKVFAEFANIIHCKTMFIFVCTVCDVLFIIVCILIY